MVRGHRRTQLVEQREKKHRGWEEREMSVDEETWEGIDFAGFIHFGCRASE